MRSINIYELKNWINRYKEVIDGAKVSKVYRTVENGFIFELYKKGLEKKYLYLIPGKSIFLSNKKLKSETDNITTVLRRWFSGASIEINIVDDERVVVFSFRGVNRKLYLEIFSQGNLVVVDENDRIIYAMIYRDFGSRKIAIGEIYSLPKNTLPLPKNPEDILNLSKSSNKKDLVRFLALDLRLTGKYAEKICKEYNLDKSKSPRELTVEESDNIFEGIQRILNGKGIIKYEEDIPKDFEIWDNGELDVNETFEKYYLFHLENKAYIKLREKINEINRILEEQRKAAEENLEKHKIYNAIGNFLSTYTWVFEKKNVDEIRRELESMGIKINKIELKGREIVIDIDEDVLKEYYSA